MDYNSYYGRNFRRRVWKTSMKSWQARRIIIIYNNGMSQIKKIEFIEIFSCSENFLYII